VTAPLTTPVVSASTPVAGSPASAGVIGPSAPLPRLLRGVGWSLIGTSVGRILAVASSVAAAQLLGADQFGRVTLALSTSLLLAAVAGLGMPIAATHQVATWRSRDRRRAGDAVAAVLATSTTGGVVTAVALVAGAPVLARFVYHDPASVGALQAAALLVLGLTVQGAQAAVLAGLEAFDRAAIGTVLSAATALAGTVVGARLDGARGAVAGAGVAALATAVIQQQLLRRALAVRGVPLVLRLRPFAGADMRAVASTSFVTGLLVLGANWVGTALLAQGTDGLVQAAHFQAATQWRTAVLHVPLAAAGPLLALLTNAAGSGDSRTHGIVSRAGLMAVGGIATGFAVVVAAASPWIAGLYGRSFTDAALPLALLVASAVPMALSQVLGQLVLSRGQLLAGVWACSAWAVLLLLSAGWLTPRWGASGLAAAHLIAYPVQLVVLAVAARRAVRPTRDESTR
jgi:O-antigen/teichoic acid export membrane protein